MSFITHLLRLRVQEEDQGTFVVWKCPKCGSLSDFHLIESRGNYLFLGLEFSRPQIMYDLRCAGCRYEVRVSPSERDQLDKARKATELWRKNELEPEAYLARLHELKAQFVEDLTALSVVWKCPKCGEENPASFDFCWNCQSGEDPKNAGLAKEAKPFPHFPRGGNPWE